MQHFLIQWSNNVLNRTSSICFSCAKRKFPIDIICEHVGTSKQYEIDKNIQEAAFNMYYLDSVRSIVQSIEKWVDDGSIQIRDDKQLNVDLGLQELFFDIIFSYEIPWLRLGLNILLGKEINSVPPAREKSAVKSLFLHEIICLDTKISQSFRKTHSLNDIQRTKMQFMQKNFLKKFFILVYFLDVLRINHVLPMKRLFIKSAPCKTSKDILIAFCKLLLKSESNIIKHLSSIGYTVSFSQSFFDEYDVGVTKINQDFRDGVIFIKLYETYYTNNKLSSLARVPSISRLQKIHNIRLLISHIFENNEVSPCPKAIADGDIESTLTILWRMFLKFENSTINTSRIIDEVHRINSVSVSCQYLSITDSLLQWCQAIANLKNVHVKNLSSDLLDGFVLCLIIQYYYPEMIPETDIEVLPVDVKIINRNWTYIRRTLKQIGHSTKFLGDFSSVTLEPMESTLLLILLFIFDSICRQKPKTKNHAAIIIQRVFKKFSRKLMVSTIHVSTIDVYCDTTKKLCSLDEFMMDQCKQVSIIRFQSRFRGYRVRKMVSSFIVAISIIQNIWRKYFLSRKHLMIRNEALKICRFLERKYKPKSRVCRFIILIQRSWRGYKIKKWFNIFRKRIICFQRRWKSSHSKFNHKIMTILQRFFNITRFKLKLSKLFRAIVRLKV
jgi:hypothetical protein